MKKDNSFKRMIYFTILFIIIVCGIIFSIQILLQDRFAKKCDYFDNFYIEAIVYFAAIFLIIDGFIALYKHKKETLKNQLTRILRITFGFVIITLHTMQIITILIVGGSR